VNDDHGGGPTRVDVVLRDVIDGDLPIFFTQHRDPMANHMAAFTVKDPTDEAAFNERWGRILNDATVTVQTIVFEGQVAGSVLSFEQFGQREVSYWIDRSLWGRGIATAALSALLTRVTTRPLHARAAKDNLASIRVLEKCGFSITGEDKGFANARGQEVEEFILELAG
jgi:RimJ/RimL family protein N-acetyltransferase